MSDREPDAPPRDPREADESFRKSFDVVDSSEPVPATELPESPPTDGAQGDD